MSLPDTQGLRLISSGIAFWKAAKLLHEDDPQSLAWAPYFVNLGFAIELGLKGFLREQGMSDAEQKALGHDLAKAFHESLARGFCPTHPLQSKLGWRDKPSLQGYESPISDRRERRSSIIEGCDLRNTVADGRSASAIYRQIQIKRRADYDTKLKSFCTSIDDNEIKGLIDAEAGFLPKDHFHPIAPLRRGSAPVIR
jgi:hypothetical protein